MTATVGEARAAIASFGATLGDAAMLEQKLQELFAALDTDKSGLLDIATAKGLVRELCATFGFTAESFDAAESYDSDLQALDADGDGKLACTEVGLGFMGIATDLSEKYVQRLSIADGENLPDSAPLPLLQ